LFIVQTWDLVYFVFVFFFGVLLFRRVYKRVDLDEFGMILVVRRRRAREQELIDQIFAHLFNIMINDDLIIIYFYCL